jgi:hypothetical protein
VQFSRSTLLLSLLAGVFFLIVVCERAATTSTFPAKFVAGRTYSLTTPTDQNGGNPRWVVSGDFNADGSLDFATVRNR